MQYMRRVQICKATNMDQTPHCEKPRFRMRQGKMCAQFHMLGMVLGATVLIPAVVSNRRSTFSNFYFQEQNGNVGSTFANVGEEIIGPSDCSKEGTAKWLQDNIKYRQQTLAQLKYLNCAQSTHSPPILLRPVQCIFVFLST